MPEEVTNTTTSEERLMGAVAHFFGVIAALIVWALQKDKSKFVRFHAVQALAFDFTVMVFSGILTFCVLGALLGGMVAGFLALANSPSPDEVTPSFFILPAMFPFGFFTCLVPFSLLLLAARAFASVSVLTGRDFHYPALGRLVENFLRDG